MKSENFQPIVRMHTPPKKTEFGGRAFEELGVIKGVEIDDTANYLLIPIRVTRDGKDVTTSWHIVKIKHEADIGDAVDFKNFEEKK